MVVGGYVYSYENPPLEVNIKFDNVEIILNDDVKDLYTNPYFLSYLINAAGYESGKTKILIKGASIISGSGYVRQKLIKQNSLIVGVGNAV
jgi:hypothetical protein